MGHSSKDIQSGRRFLYVVCQMADVLRTGAGTSRSKDPYSVWCQNGCCQKKSAAAIAFWQSSMMQSTLTSEIAVRSQVHSYHAAEPIAVKAGILKRTNVSIEDRNVQRAGFLFAGSTMHFSQVIPFAGRVPAILLKAHIAMALVCCSILANLLSWQICISRKDKEDGAFPHMNEFMCIHAP